MSKLIKKNFAAADEHKQPVDKISMDAVELGGISVSRVTAQPGWKWSIDLKPLLKTDSCPIEHLLYVVSGTMTVRMDDGQEESYGPGDLAHIPPGHDGWGTSDEPTVWIELPH